MPSPRSQSKGGGGIFSLPSFVELRKDAPSISRMRRSIPDLRDVAAFAQALPGQSRRLLASLWLAATQSPNARNRLRTLALIAVAALVTLYLHTWILGLRSLPDEEEVAEAKALAQTLRVSLPTWVQLDSGGWASALSGDDASLAGTAYDPLALARAYTGKDVWPLQRKRRPDWGGFSQFGEDFFAYDSFFYRKRNGIFLELGALDGYSYSNTFFFEKFMGWKGLLIEAGQQAYQSLLRNRPKSVCLNAAVCTANQLVHYRDAIHGSVAVGGIYEYMPASFRQRWHADVNPRKLPLTACASLASILERLGLRHINFFSLDVEGAEWEVLKTVDFTRVTFDVLVVEALGDDKAKDAQIQKLLRKNGFVFYTSQATNIWFHREGFKPMVNPKPDGAYWRGEGELETAPQLLRSQTGTSRRHGG